MMRKFLLLALVCLLTVTGAWAQRTVKGRITDEAGVPIQSASVIVKGTHNGTTTDVLGNFTLALPPNSKVLIVSALGYGGKEIALNNESTFNISLAVATGKSMQEVVVVAYGTAKKESLTGAVTSVNASAIEKRPLTNAVAALEGSAAGIQVNNTVGQPGSSPSIRIRGFSSVNYDNEPLYVIDGVPFGGNVADINPADIESISVLKDVASSALYGNRAANGVIIMTTKKGTKNATSINFTMNQGFYDKGINEYKKMGPNDFMETMWKGYKNSLRTSQPGTYTTDALAGAKATKSLISDYLKLNIYDKPDTALFDNNGKMVSDAHIKPQYADDLDWYKGYERLGQRSDYNLSGRTGTDKSSLYFSVGYLNEKGYINYSDFKRFSGRVNAELQATKWFKYGFNIAGTHQVSNNTPAGTDQFIAFVNPIFFSRTIAPIYPVHLHDPATGDYVLDALGNKQYDDGSVTRNEYVGRHAIWENELNKDQFFRNTVMGQAYATISLPKNFTVGLVADVNSRTDDEQVYNNAIIGDGSGNHGRASRNNYRYLNYTLRQTVSWNQKFNNVHNVEVMAAHENFNYEYNNLFGYKTNEAFPGQVQLANFTSITALYDTRDVYRTEGYLTRGRYSFEDKYFFEASFRRDASSKFFDRWGNFWSVGGSWTISKEKFFDHLTDKVNFLKLRASYGEVGNDAGVPYYAWQSLYDLNQNANATAVYRMQFENLNLHWETSTSLDAAVEGRIFERANVAIEYFDKKSKDLIFKNNLPLSAGATSSTDAESVLIQNIGSVSNRGWEFTFDVDVIRNKDFSFNFGANATVMKNKVVKMPEANRKNGIINGTKKIMEGHSVYDYWLPQFVGVDQMTGNALYLADTVNYSLNSSASNAIPGAYLVTINGQTYTTYTTYAKRDWSGSAIPDVFGSFSSTFRYKNFTLGGIFTYALGGKIYDNSYISLMTMNGTVNALHKNLLKAWDGVPKDITATSDNRIDPKGTPVVDFARADKNYASSTQFLQSASYLVVKNINLSYKFSDALISKLQLKSLTVGVSADNLYTATKLRGMNPQQAFTGINDNTFVTPRVVSFILNVGL